MLLLCTFLLCFASLRFASLCFALLRFASLCFALLCFALLCFALLCFALLCLNPRKTQGGRGVAFEGNKVAVYSIPWKTIRTLTVTYFQPYEPKCISAQGENAKFFWGGACSFLLKYSYQSATWLLVLVLVLVLVGSQCC